MSELTAKDIHSLVGIDDPVLLEIGCNDGTDTLRFLEAMPQAGIYVFEPDPRAIVRYRETVDSTLGIQLAKTAISDVDGSAVFYGSSGVPPVQSRKPGATHYVFLPEWDLSGSLLKPTGHLARSPWVTFPEDRRYTVKTLRLDTWLEGHLEITEIDFIWCDVQGAEAAVIRGAQTALSVTRYFYTEFYDIPLYDGQVPLAELRRMLPSFDVVGIYGENALFKNRELAWPL